MRRIAAVPAALAAVAGAAVWAAIDAAGAQLAAAHDALDEPADPPAGLLVLGPPSSARR